MNDDKGLFIEGVLDKTCSAMWLAWTEPELIRKWWRPAGFSAPSVKVDLKVGGKYIFSMHGLVGSSG